MKAELMPLADLMRDYRDGDEHGWDTEFEWLRSNHQDRIDALIESAKKKGIQKPILLGSDARVWDGHHRILVAYMLGLENVPVKRRRQSEVQAVQG